MNYENLYQALQPDEKNVKDQLSLLQKLFKAIHRETENGDIRSLARDLAVMAESAASVSASLNDMKNSIEAFDTKEYFENGDFAEQMLASCQENHVDVRGEFPVYEMFPYRVRLDTVNQDIYLDRKKVQCMRPQSLVHMIKTDRKN